jgi:glutamine synthetase
MLVEQYYPSRDRAAGNFDTIYPSIRAADQQIAFRETIRAIALQHNLKASFLPKIFADKAGSGCHLHLSLWQDGQNLLPNLETPGELSQSRSSLHCRNSPPPPSTMALTTPSTNSYRASVLTIGVALFAVGEWIIGRRR